MFCIFIVGRSFSLGLSSISHDENVDASHSMTHYVLVHYLLCYICFSRLIKICSAFFYMTCICKAKHRLGTKDKAQEDNYRY